MIRKILNSKIDFGTSEEFLAAHKAPPSPERICACVIMALVQEHEKDFKKGIQVVISLGGDTDLTVDMLEKTPYLMGIIEESFKIWKDDPSALEVIFEYSLVSSTPKPKFKAEIIDDKKLRYSRIIN